MTSPDWSRALTALTLLAIDPAGLKGLTIRARPGPAHQTVEDALKILPVPLRRIHPGLSDTQLFGGLNVAASLAEGRMIRDPGLADTPSALVLPMAERTPPGLAARLAQLLDASRDHALLLLDEGAEPEEAAPACLTERLAFHVDLSHVPHAEARPLLPAPADIDAARARLPNVTLRPDDAQTLVALAARFGIASLRAPLLAQRAALALAALDARAETTDDDLRHAAELVYPARATMIPEQPDTPEPQPEETPENQTDSDTTSDLTDLPDDLIVEAIAALLPPDLLTQLEKRARASRAAQGSGAGTKRTGNRRGRPLPSRPGRPDGRARIDIIATLRAAAPWQPLRREARPDGPRLIIHPADIRLRRYEDRSDRLVIFTVDASGSAAMARMAEAKGAVELMLAQAYAKRDQVALIAFRGEGAEILLSPTRSLVQAKRQLAGLPGGGGTPLASGLRAALDLTDLARTRGLSPALALLTDGRANIALDGTPGRATAASDAEAMARRLSHLGLSSVVIDTAARPGRDGTALAAWLNAQYLALPRADARHLAAATDAALTG